ncbi:MAG TPA: ABC transporter substrate-binding protein [Pelovirga sp.]|nr:ABC transporter substrate-binding protein [Pelovirga sp.]
MRKITKILYAILIVLMMAGLVQAKTLKLAMDADPVSLDPHVQLSGGMLQYSHMVFDPLVRWTKETTIEGRLAERWERLDEYTVRFYLKEGVKFHSGNELTADDVIWTVNRLKNSVDFKGIFEPFAVPVKVDKYTVDLVTKVPYPLLLNTATYIFPMDSEFYSGTDDRGMDKGAIVKTDYSFANENLSGTGKYRVVERQQGVKVVFDEFAGYWDKSSPGNVDKIILTPIKNDATRVAALLSGGVDFIMPVPPQDMDRIEKADNVKLVTMSGTRIITLQLNQSRVDAFKDPQVRQAIVYAVNNAGIAEKLMKGRATVGAQNSPKGYLGHNPALTPRYDLDKAKQLMAEAGYAKGFEVSMIAPNNRYVNDEKIAEAAASMLGKIGIKVNLKTMPKAQYWDQFDAQVADIQMIGWHSDTEDTGNFFEFLLMCPNKETGYGQYNSGNYCNPEVDRLTLAVQSETDQAKRIAMMQQMEQIAYDDAAFVPLHWQDLSWAGKENLRIEPIVNVMNFPYFGDLVVD